MCREWFRIVGFGIASPRRCFLANILLPLSGKLCWDDIYTGARRCMGMWPRIRMSMALYSSCATRRRYPCFCVTASAYLRASVSLHRCGSASSDSVFLSLCALAPLSLCASVFYVSVFLSLGRCVSVPSCRMSLRVCVFVGFCMCVCARVWVSLRGCVSVCLCLYVLAYLCVSFCVSVFGVSFVCVYVWLCVWVRECIMSFRAPVSARLPVSEPLCPCASVSSSRCAVVRV